MEKPTRYVHMWQPLQLERQQYLSSSLKKSCIFSSSAEWQKEYFSEIHISNQPQKDEDRKILRKALNDLYALNEEHSH